MAAVMTDKEKSECSDFELDYNPPMFVKHLLYAGTQFDGTLD